MFLDNISLGLFIGLVALIVASLWDIRTREVPDWISYSLVFFAIGYTLFLSIYHANPWFIFNSIAGGLLGLIIGLIMFYTGQWGGGDSKLMIGIGAIFGFALPKISLLHSNQEILFFMLNTIFVGAIYGFLYSMVLAILNFKKCAAEVRKISGTQKMIYVRIALVLFVGLSLCFYMITRSFESILFFIFSIVSIILFYIWLLVRTVEKVCMIKTAKVSDLTEGDWVIEEVKKNEKTILAPTKTGISLEEIGLLKKNSIKSVTIKVGIPFVPSFLIAYVLTILFSSQMLALLF